MFCSNCGTQVVQGLNYCKNCGAKVNRSTGGSTEKMSEASFNFLIAAMLAVPIVGIGLVIGLLTVMKKDLGFRDEMIMGVAIMSFCLLLFAEGGIIWLLLHRTRKSKESVENDNARMNEVVIKGIGGVPARNLSEGISEPIPSIIEHTTRQLEMISREPKA